MGVSEYAAWQARKQRRETEQTMPVRHLYPEPKKDRRTDTGIQRMSGKGKKRGK
jgi:hypothetical protein